MSNSEKDPKAIVNKKESHPESTKLDEEELNRLAAEELMKEAKVLANIADVEGALGWKRRRTLKTNKMFLQRTVRHALSSNKRKNNVKSIK